MPNLFTKLFLYVIPYSHSIPFHGWFTECFSVSSDRLFCCCCCFWRRYLIGLEFVVDAQGVWLDVEDALEGGHHVRVVAGRLDGVVAHQIVGVVGRMARRHQLALRTGEPTSALNAPSHLEKKRKETKNEKKILALRLLHWFPNCG